MKLISQDSLLEIQNHSRKTQTLLIGIDGYGGSGKTTVTKELKDNLSHVSVVEMDDLYNPKLKKPDVRRVLAEVLIPLSQNMVAEYPIYQWQSDSYVPSATITPGGIVIVEGVYSLHPTLFPYYDYTILVDCDPDTAASRGIQRDLILDNTDKNEIWKNVWLPEEKKYFNENKLNTKVDLVLQSG